MEALGLVTNGDLRISLSFLALPHLKQESWGQKKMLLSDLSLHGHPNKASNQLPQTNFCHELRKAVQILSSFTYILGASHWFRKGRSICALPGMSQKVGVLSWGIGDSTAETSCRKASWPETCSWGTPAVASLVPPCFPRPECENWLPSCSCRAEKAVIMGWLEEEGCTAQRLGYAGWYTSSELLLYAKDHLALKNI